LGRPLPWKYWRCWLAERFGWTLDYVDSLSHREAVAVIAITQAADEAFAANARRDTQHQRAVAKMHAKSRRG